MNRHVLIFFAALLLCSCSTEKPVSIWPEMTPQWGTARPTPPQTACLYKKDVGGCMGYIQNPGPDRCQNAVDMGRCTFHQQSYDPYDTQNGAHDRD